METSLVHFGQPNIRPEAEMWLGLHTSQICMQWRLLSFSATKNLQSQHEAIGFSSSTQAQHLTYIAGKMALNRHLKKDHSMNNSLTKIRFTLSQKAIFRHKNRENLSKTIIRVTFIGRPGRLTLYRSGWF